MRKLIIFFLLFVISIAATAQSEKYPCQFTGISLLIRMVGSWQVIAKDRISKDVYEDNSGISVISAGSGGCSILGNFKGEFKGRPYMVNTSYFMSDSLHLQRVFYDSEHAEVLLYDGVLSTDRMKLRWSENPKVGKMQVKFELNWINNNAFEWVTYLTTNYGKSWQLTHHWQYERLDVFDIENADHTLIKQSLKQYHEGLSSGNPDSVASVLGKQFIMWNGNYSTSMLNWQAHMALSELDIYSWPKNFIEEAGPYHNDFEILSIHTRANAAVVTTIDNGQNKFRKWKDEQTMWLLGKVQGDWKILGYYLQNISNP